MLYDRAAWRSARLDKLKGTKRSYENEAWRAADHDKRRYEDITTAGMGTAMDPLSEGCTYGETGTS
jgi:hypothetical protein